MNQVLTLCDILWHKDSRTQSVSDAFKQVQARERPEWSGRRQDTVPNPPSHTPCCESIGPVHTLAQLDIIQTFIELFKFSSHVCFLT